MINDSADDAVQMETAFRRFGYTAVCERVSTPKRFWDALLPEREWDVITCDSGVPGLSAWLAMSLAQYALPTVPVVLVSTHRPPEDELEMANGFLCKRDIQDLPAVLRCIGVLNSPRGYSRNRRAPSSPIHGKQPCEDMRTNASDSCPELVGNRADLISSADSLSSYLDVETE
jgi:hypothetical protein